MCSYLVPALPIIGEPGLFLTFFELRPRNPEQEQVRKSHNNRYRNAFSEEFRLLAFKGDRRLQYYSDDILSELLGVDNRLLIEAVAAHWNSNGSWLELTLAYGIDRYVGWRPRGYPVNGCDPSKGLNKFWADIWEAYWEIIFRERELWNEGIDDLLSVLRLLMFRKYSTIIENYSTIYLDDINPASLCLPSTPATRDGILYKTVDRHDPHVVDCLGPAPLQMDDYHYGHLATVTAPSIGVGDTTQAVSIYAISKETAGSRALFHLNSGCKGLASLL